MLGKSDPNVELLDAAALCRQLVPEGSVYAFLADHRKELFPDELFQDLFLSGRGRPSLPGELIASAMILKELEGLSDRQAADALRCDIRWKVATGLPLDHPGVHYTVFTYWRTRLNQSTRPERIREAVGEVIKATGVLHNRNRRALDSTLLDDAVATQDTVTQLVASIRRVRKLVPEVASVPVSAHDYDSTGKPVCAWDDPEARQALVSGLVNDALRSLQAAEGVELNSQQADAVGLLALVAGQDVEPGDTDGTWRIADRVAPDRIISVIDPESRHMHKSRSEYRDGYKAHVVVEPETGLITAVEVTAANAPDGSTGVSLVSDEGAGLTLLADSAYGSAETRIALRSAGHQLAIKPIPARSAVPGGFNRDDFIVDHQAMTATCPAGHTTSIASSGRAYFRRFCRSCPLMMRCTRSAKGKVLTLYKQDAELSEARRAWREGDFAEDYRRWRPMVERSLAWLVAQGNRRLRYRGIQRNRQGLSTRVAAINLRRLVNLGLNHNGGWAVAG